MAKKPSTGSYSASDYEESVDSGLKALIMQQVTGGENPHEIFNTLIKQNRCKRLYNSDGATKPVSALALHLEAEKATRHASKLNRNLGKQASMNESITTKQTDDESHHIVAAREPRAALSRRVIFSVGIGINAWQNGININKAAHRPIHTTVYYMEVNRRLATAERACIGESASERHDTIEDGILTMRDEIDDNVFPY